MIQNKNSVPVNFDGNHNANSNSGLFGVKPFQAQQNPFMNPSPTNTQQPSLFANLSPAQPNQPSLFQSASPVHTNQQPLFNGWTQSNPQNSVAPNLFSTSPVNQSPFGMVQQIPENVQYPLSNVVPVNFQQSTAPLSLFALNYSP